MGIRIGIVGAGTTVAIADRHVEGFLAQAGRCTVAAVCSRTLEGCRRLCVRHGLDGVRMTTRLEELLDVVDAVVLCTPNQFHLPYTERAVERGKAVLLEKPLGLQTAPPGQAERLLARRDARVMVAYVYRYTAVVERLRSLLRQRMGRVYLAQASQGGTRLADPAVPLEWRMRRSASGSGALGDFGSHLLDLLQYAAGVELAEAAGYGGTFLPTRRPDGQGNTCVENDDAFVFCGRGAGGALCSVSVSRVGLDGIHLCISGEGGLLRASVEEGVLTYWPKAPDGPYAPEGEARSEHLAEPPGSALRGRPRRFWIWWRAARWSTVPWSRPSTWSACSPAWTSPPNRQIPLPPKYGGRGIPLSLHQLSQQRLELDPLQNRGASARVWAAHRWTNSAARWAAVSSGSPRSIAPSTTLAKRSPVPGNWAGSCLAIAKRMRPVAGRSSPRRWRPAGGSPPVSTTERPPIQAQPLQPRPQPLFVPGQIGVVLLQQQRRLGQVGGDHVRLGRQIPHTPAQLRRVGAVGLPVVPHHRVHQHQRPLPAELAVEVLYQPDLPGRARKPL